MALFRRNTGMTAMTGVLDITSPAKLREAHLLLVPSTVTVHDVAVESMTDNSAIVLVAATTEAKGAEGPPQPRSWHIALGLRRDGGKPKMANIEFVQ